MAIDDSTYSRIVAWLKIILPFAALALLSTLFLVARTVDPAQQLPFADVDIDEITREQRIGHPNYSGVTADGTAIALSAESASPELDDPQNVTGKSVNANMQLPDGEEISITAGTMNIDYANATATLRQSVEIKSVNGLKLSTSSLEVALDTTSVRSDNPTTLDATFGKVSADSFALTPKDKSNTNYVLVFKGSVKLIYTPEE